MLWQFSWQSQTGKQLRTSRKTGFYHEAIRGEVGAIGCWGFVCPLRVSLRFASAIPQRFRLQMKEIDPGKRIFQKTNRLIEIFKHIRDIRDVDHRVA